MSSKKKSSDKAPAPEDVANRLSVQTHFAPQLESGETPDADTETLATIATRWLDDLMTKGEKVSFQPVARSQRNAPGATIGS